MKQSHPMGPPDEIMVISGGATGIGFEVALQWLNRSGRVILMDRNADALEAAVVELGPKARGIQVDVTNAVSVHQAMKNVAREEGKINALVNCAGFAKHANIEDSNDADFTQMLEVHLTGTQRVCREALPLLQVASDQQESAAVVNLSSVAGINGTSGRLSYSTAKAGIMGLTRTLAVELGPKQIRVNAVNPSAVKTALVEELIQDNEVMLEPLMKRTPLRRVAEVAEIASPIVFLCSRQASFVTGVCLPLDGGLTIEGNWYD